MWHVKSPSEFTQAKKLGDIIDRVWASSSEKPPAQSRSSEEPPKKNPWDGLTPEQAYWKGRSAANLDAVNHGETRW